jgi:hypothetical protein
MVPAVAQDFSALGREDVVVFKVSFPDGREITAFQPIGRELRVEDPSFGVVTFSPTTVDTQMGHVSMAVAHANTSAGTPFDVAFQPDTVSLAVGGSGQLHAAPLEVMIEAVITLDESPIDAEKYFYAKEYGIQLTCCVTCGQSTACGDCVYHSCGQCCDPPPCHS